MYRVIFEHHPKKNQEKEFMIYWKKGSDIIQMQKGARGTKLFRSLKNPKVMYAMADWESKEARDKAIEKLSKREDAQFVLHGHEKYVSSHKVIAEGELVEVSNIISHN
ncbi:hypothetical protein FJZ21_02575 [Candidatus Pacearchaeota archaeon]|nr:hypothetical protein [Candidatus Pacearchaeota archaeon]